MTAIDHCNGQLFNSSKIVVQPARGAEDSKSTSDNKVTLPNPNVSMPSHQPTYS